MRPGSIFSEAQTRPAGHIFFIPREERLGDDPKDRPHFLVNRCDPAAGPYVLATLAHMTTKATEIVDYGCTGHEIPSPAQAQGFGRDGNFVITSRLIPLLARRLTRSQLSATDEVRSVRRSVLQAVGIGEGVGMHNTGSVRGRMVRVLDQQADFQYGFVLTTHNYSRQRRFQIIVPVIDRVVEAQDGDGLEELELSPWDVLPAREPWFDQVDCAEPLLDTAALISLSEEWQKSRDPQRWLKKQIHVTGITIDPSTLAKIELKISERLHS